MGLFGGLVGWGERGLPVALRASGERRVMMRVGDRRSGVAWMPNQAAVLMA